MKHDIYTAATIMKQLTKPLLDKRLVLSLYGSVATELYGNDIDLVVTYIGDALAPGMHEVVALICQVLRGSQYKGCMHYTKTRHHVVIDYRPWDTSDLVYHLDIMMAGVLP